MEPGVFESGTESNDIPRFLLGDPEVCGLSRLLTEADKVVMTADELVPQRL